MIYIYIAAAFLGVLVFTVLVVALRKIYFKFQKWSSRRRRAELLEELAKLNVFRWRDELPTNDTCAICRETFIHRDPLRILPCTHGYHVPCIDTWIQEGNLYCPLCNKAIIPRAERYLPPDFIENSDENTPLLAT